jgi:hypothetical protein
MVLMIRVAEILFPTIVPAKKIKINRAEFKRRCRNPAPESASGE